MSLFSSKKINNYLLPTGLTECATGADILKQRAPNILTEIKNLVSVTDELYKKLYLTTLYTVAEFCQAMPLTKKDVPYSLLNNQLNCCVTALKLRRGILLPKNAGAETIAEQEARWTFAVFSVSLLYQLHLAQQNRKIYLHNRQGDLIDSWHPLIGSLYYADACYSTIWEVSNTIEPITLKSALAMRFISPQVIRWLIQDKQVQSNWWDAITNPQSSNIITEIILNAVNTISTKNSKDNNTDGICQINLMNAANNTGSKAVINHDFLESLLTWLFDYQYELPNGEPTFFKIEQGLFIHEKMLQEFLIKNTIKDMTFEKLIDHIKNYLIEKNGNYLFRFRPKAYADRRIFQGIILQQEQLSTGWKQFPIIKDYQFDIPL